MDLTLFVAATSGFTIDVPLRYGQKCSEEAQSGRGLDRSSYHTSSSMSHSPPLSLAKEKPRPQEQESLHAKFTMCPDLFHAAHHLQQEGRQHERFSGRGQSLVGKAEEMSKTGKE